MLFLSIFWDPDGNEAIPLHTDKQAPAKHGPQFFLWFVPITDHNIFSCLKAGNIQVLSLLTVTPVFFGIVPEHQFTAN